MILATDALATLLLYSLASETSLTVLLFLVTLPDV